MLSVVAPPGLALRFTSLIDGLCRAVAAHIARDRAAGPLILLICGHLRRKAARFAALAALAQAGRHATPRRPRPQAAPRPPRPHRLPRDLAWLIRRIPATAAHASLLRQMLAEPEISELLAAAPQARRVLRPLCRALGIVPLPDLLRPPPLPAPVPSPRPAPAASGPPLPAPFPVPCPGAADPAVPPASAPPPSPAARPAPD